MFGVGWTEMLVIGVVALVVIGPKDLPVVMQRLGKFVASIRRMGTEFQREINKTTGLDQITDLRRSLTEPLRQTSAEIAREFNAMTSTGVQPSGAIKPEDPKVESVYSAINSAAGGASTPEAVEPAPSPEVAATSALANATPTVAKPKAVRKPRTTAAKAASVKPATTDAATTGEAGAKAKAPRRKAVRTAASAEGPDSAATANPTPKAAKPRAKKA